MILTYQIDFGYGFVNVPAPRNSDGLMINILFTSQTPNAIVTGVDLEWDGDTAVKLNAYKRAGTNGGTGITEGVGLKIYNCDLFFEGYIDLQSAKTRWSCDLVVAPAVQFGRVDWLEARARGISFGYLKSLPVGSPGRIVPATDYKKTPYCVTKYRSRSEKITIELEIAGLLFQIYDVTCKIAQSINDLIADATNTTVTLGLLIARVLFDLLNIILYVIYLLAIIIALIDLILKFISAYFQFKKYKTCMTWETLFTRIAERFGMAFKSTILQQGPFVGMTWMPPKTVIPAPTNPLNIFTRPADEGQGFPNNPNVIPYPQGNCASWIEQAEKYFDATIVILPDPSTGLLTLYFENKFYWNNVAVFTIPNLGKVGNTFNLPDPYGTNLSELPSNYLVEFQIDQSDENTFMRYKGTTCSCTVSQTVVHDERCVSHNTGVNVSLSTALAKRKEYLNETEEKLNELFGNFSDYLNTAVPLVNGVINQMNIIINIFGGSSATPLPTFSSFSPLSARIGWLELSGDDFSIAKVFVGYNSNGDWVIRSDNETTVSAENLFKLFHGKNLATRGNQQDLYFDREFDFCCSDFRKISQSNIVTTPRGLGKLISFTWNLHDEKAINVIYSTFVLETSNLHETLFIDE